jgi:two-component system, OmpR family, sensor histidine kinase CreC
VVISTIRARLLLACLLLVTAGLLLMARLVLKDVRPHTFGATEDSLAETAVMLASLVEVDAAGGRLNLERLRATLDVAGHRPLQARIYDIEKKAVDLRVYVTDPQGVVVFDSDGGRDLGQDYSRWRDVRQALSLGYGARATRRDRTDAFSSVFYVAVPVRHGDQAVGVLAVGKQAKDLKLLVTGLNRKIALAGLVALGAAVGLALLFTQWITLPIRRLAGYAHAVAAGERPPLPALHTREVMELGQAFETMRDALDGRRDIEGYVRSLTHETKAPLSAIRAAAELLEEGPPSPEQRRFLANIRSESQRLQELVDRILELSALEARRSLEGPVAVSLAELVAEAAASSEPLLKQKELRLSVEVEPQAVVAGDPLLLRQALLNLLHNAVRWTPPGGEVAVEARAFATAVVVVVSDTGPGLPDYALARAFEKFYSLAPPGQEKGTGLGLPFVQEVAALHGGHARIENRAEGGARAVLTLARPG